MYFECARQLEADLRRKEKAKGGDLNVVWYVLSDCKGLRENAKQEFGDKVITSLDVDVDHSTNNNLSSKVVNAFHVAVGENWLLGMTDYRIFSEHSSFGRVSALRSMKDTGNFAVKPISSPPNNSVFQGPRRIMRCGASDYDKLTDMKDW